MYEFCKKVGQKYFLQKSTPLNSIRRKRGFVNKYLEKEGENGTIRVLFIGNIPRGVFVNGVNSVR